MVTDSGGNDLVSVKNGKVQDVAPFYNRMGTSPVTGPDPVPYESVPTDVVKGPDGAFYVSELTGFPFIPGAARIWRVVPGHTPTVWATGLTNVTSLAFARQEAVRRADRRPGPDRRRWPGRVAAPGVPGRRPGGPRSVIAGGLFAPYGVAIHHGAAYVSTGAVAPTGGR